MSRPTCKEKRNIMICDNTHSSPSNNVRYYDGSLDERCYTKSCTLSCYTNTSSSSISTDSSESIISTRKHDSVTSETASLLSNSAKNTYSINYFRINSDSNRSINSITDDRSGSSGSSSSGSSSSSSEQSVTSTLYSLLSDVLFFAGSALQLWLALWDMRKENEDDDFYDDDDDDYDDGFYDDVYDDDDWVYPTMFSAMFWTHYRILSAVAALFLIGNSVFDIVWSLRDARYNSGKRESKFQIAAAVAFGIAATCDLASVCVTGYEHPDLSYIASTIGVHVYLLNAVLAVIANKPSCQYLSTSLTTSGDILFLIASVIDLTLNYIGIPLASDGTWHAVDIANIVASALWLVDAVLYIAADIIDINEYYYYHIGTGKDEVTVEPSLQYVIVLSNSFESQ